MKIGKGKEMKEYTVVYIKDDKEYARDIYNTGTTIKDIVDELNCSMNRYGVDYDYVTIFDANNEEDIVYFKVVNINGYYVLSEM